MNPMEALPRDYRLYYDGTYMRWRHEQIVAVQSDNGHFMVKPYQSDYVEADPADLEVWFPRPGAYHTLGGAVYIGRRSRRSMKRSAHQDHYWTKWGRIIGGDNMMWLMARQENTPYVPFGIFNDAPQLMTSAAVSRNLILSASNKVIWRGMETGQIVDGEYKALNEFDPVNEYVKEELRRVQARQ